MEISSVRPRDIQAQRDLCDRLQQQWSERDGQARQLHDRYDALGQYVQDMQTAQAPLERRVSIADKTGKLAAGAVLCGLATFGMNPLIGAGLFFGGLAGFAASYMWQFKNRVKHNAIEAARAQAQDERQRASTSASTLQAQAEAAQRSLTAARDRLRVLELTSVADAANQGPQHGAVQVEDTSVKLGAVRVPRNI